MKKVLLLMVLISGLQANAQWKHSIEAGGSNFTGIAFTTEYQFQLSKTKPIYLAPKLGIGHIFFWDHTLTVQGGFDVGYWFNSIHGLAFTTSGSYLINSPIPQNTDNGFFRQPSSESGNFLWYTGLDYKFRTKKTIYSFGLGTTTMISRFEQIQNPSLTYSVEDFIPMLKLGITF